MNIQLFLSKLSREALVDLSQSETADHLRELAAVLGHTLTAEEAEVAYAALYPLRDGAINDDALEAVCGGLKPRATNSDQSNIKSRKENSTII